MAVRLKLSEARAWKSAHSGPVDLAETITSDQGLDPLDPFLYAWSVAGRQARQARHEAREEPRQELRHAPDDQRDMATLSDQYFNRLQCGKVYGLPLSGPRFEPTTWAPPPPLGGRAM